MIRHGKQPSFDLSLPLDPARDAWTLPLISRLVPHFGESPEDLPTTLFESAPTVLFTVPRYLQKFASQVLLGILNSSSSKRATADLALRFARGHARRRWNGEARSAVPAVRACSCPSSTSSALTGWSS